jgi:hypothetical protein
MDAHKLQVKLFAESHAGVTLPDFIPIFHGWIRDAALKELLVDVANYAHVPEGPGVVLIGHGSDYAMDDGQGRFGLLYSRKRATHAPDRRLGDAFRRALHVAQLLERDPALGGKLRFGTGEILFRINDRLAAPATDATLAAVRDELGAMCTRLFGGAPYELARVGTPRDLFQVRITSASRPSLAALLERAGGAPDAD